MGYIHLPLKNAPAAREYKIQMVEKSTTKDAFGAVREIDPRNNERLPDGKSASLKIVEIEFLKNIRNIK